MTEQRATFTAVYDWLAARKDLTSTEKLLVAHILRYDRSGGCFKSNTTLARDLGLDRSTVIRLLGDLIRRDWVAPLYPSRRERLLFINQAMLEGLPLFGGTGGAKAVKKPVKSQPKRWWQNATTRWRGWWQNATAALQNATTLNKTSKDLSYTDEREPEDRITDEVNFLASVMTETKQTARAGVSQAELNRRRNDQRRALGLEADHGRSAAARQTDPD